MVTSTAAGAEADAAGAVAAAQALAEAMGGPPLAVVPKKRSESMRRRASGEYDRSVQ